MATNNLTFFPAQKKSTSQKNKKWMQDCVDAADEFTNIRDHRIRQSQYNKKVNYDLYNDILDQRDIERITNPYNIRNASFPAKMQNYPIVNPKIDLLVGEEFKRRFDWRVRSVNSDAISKKSAEKRDKIMQTLINNLQNDQVNDEAVQKELKELNKYFSYEYQDLKEENATRILTYLYKEQDLQLKFNAGFMDALLAAEEIYCADIVSGEPILRRCNPLNIFNIRSGDSHHIEDSDLIIEYSYDPIGEVIDNYYNELTPKQITDIEEGYAINSTGGIMNNEGFNPVFDVADFVREQNGQILEVNSKGARFFGGAYDPEGNIKVTRVVWRSRRKVGELKYYDQDGDPQTKLVDEKHKADKSKGEEIEWIWINEWWEGTKIGDSIYVKMGPRPIQFRNMTNLSKCGPGYVGTFYATNDSKAKSLMDRMKPYQYLYNTFMYRTELAFAKSKGKIAELDLSKVPDDWDLDKWMYYAEVMGWAPIDNFKEGKKGAATGKIAGNFNTTGRVLDLEMGGYIQQHIMMLQYLETQVGEIAGVSRQRQGQVENRELVGNVERAVTQSAHITERWFSIHDNVKLRALTMLLDTAKHAWRKEKKVLQYITDDLSTVMFEVDGEEFASDQYGLFVSNTRGDHELLSSLKQLAHAGIQNDKISFSQLMDIYTSDSISSIRRKIESAELEKEQQRQKEQQQAQEMQQQQQQAQQQAQQQQIEAATQDREDKQAHEIEKTILDNDTKIEVALINAESKAMDRDANNNGIRDDIDMQKLQQQAQKLNQDYELKQREQGIKEKQLGIQEKKAADDTEIKRETLNRKPIGK
jgi:hypothetical protein